jgi:hypothetical protein
MSNKYDVSVITEKHKQLDRKVKITTITKKNKKKILSDDVIMVAQSMMKQNPDKKLMIKGLSAVGYITLKGYNDNLDAILDEEDYFNSRENSEHGSLYKVSFYLL